MRKKKHEEHVNHERWLVSYADFITLLFAFFTTLYAISTVDQKKAGKLMYSMRSAFNIDIFQSAQAQPGNGAPIELDDVVSGGEQAVGRDKPGGSVKPAGADAKQTYDALAAELEAIVSDPELSGRVKVTREQRGIVVSLMEAGFFASGSATVRAEGLEGLAAMARAVGKTDLEVIVEGHTDDRPVVGGRYTSNWELSTARASMVVGYLISKHGFDPQRLSAAGYGEYRPLVANDTVAGRARNRRVDIVIKAPVLRAK